MPQGFYAASPDYCVIYKQRPRITTFRGDKTLIGIKLTARIYS